MDKETAVEFERVKAELRADRLRIKEMEGKFASWNSLIKKAIVKSITYLLAAGTLGLMYGWHLPENIRKAFIEWVSK